MRYIILVLLLIAKTSIGQVPNGGFEEWSPIWCTDLPDNWDATDTYWDPTFRDCDNNQVIFKDTSSYEGQYAVLLIGGTIYEHTCQRRIKTTFEIPQSNHDSLFFNFAHKSVSQNSFGNVSIRIALNDSTVFLRTEEETEYLYHSIKFSNPEGKSVNIDIACSGSTSGTDACIFQSDHWLDAISITSGFDSDQDGFDSLYDCDDNNININPAQVEQPYNGVDDDCNPATLDDDLDQDGFLLADDCDDNNSNVNPDAIDIPNNGIDEDCNGLDSTQVEDRDGDGITNETDCNDDDPTIYPGAEELCDEKDNDCDGIVDEELVEIHTYKDDDGDGFGGPLIYIDCGLKEGFVDNGHDCDDTNPNVNPNADEIPNNGIDEDCDGMDLISSTHSIEDSKVLIYPIPTTDIIYINIGGQFNFEINLYDMEGILVQKSSSTNQVKVDNITPGTYLLMIKDNKTNQKMVEKIVIYR